MLLLAAIAFVIVMWSTSTAVIFYLDSLPAHTFKYSMAAATLVLIGCSIAMVLLEDQSSTEAIATSFAAGLLAWGWTEMALYMGYITGPRKKRCAEGCSGLQHFGHAVNANLWHEIVVIIFAIVIYLSANETSLWAYTMLWLMHLSARLNVFLGVRNVSAEFVPEHMDVLKGFLRQRTMNPLFPFSCLILIALTGYLISSAQTFAMTMAATLASIGLLEHVLLMLPLPIEKMWAWSLSNRVETENVEAKADHHRHTAVGALL